jgi:hypothetical protein
MNIQYRYFLEHFLREKKIQYKSWPKIFLGQGPDVSKSPIRIRSIIVRIRTTLPRTTKKAARVWVKVYNVCVKFYIRKYILNIYCTTSLGEKFDWGKKGVTMLMLWRPVLRIRSKIVRIRWRRLFFFGPPVHFCILLVFVSSI